MKKVTIEDVDYDKIEAELNIEIKRDEGFSFHGDYLGLTILKMGYIEMDYFISIQELIKIKEKRR